MITERHPNQNPVNLDILNWVQAHGPCTGRELLTRFCPNPDSRDECKRFTLKLGYLVYSDQLACEGRGGLRGTFSLGDSAIGCTSIRTALKGRASSAPDLPAHVSPWQIPITASAPAYDSMHAPVYVPPPMQAARPGALDYRRIASQGHRC